MDSSTLDTFFALLRSGLYGTPAEADAIQAPVDWGAVMEMARQQTVMGLVFDAAARLPEGLQPDARVKSQMMQLSLRVMNTHQMLDATLAEVSDFYRRRGIGCVLLKGQGIARCYRQPHLRQCGDIDLYVGKANYARSVDLARSDLGADAEASESIKHFHFQHGTVTVELHRLAALMYTPVRRRRLDRWLVSELENPQRLRELDFNGSRVTVPSADFDAFFIFYHAWHHFFRGGIGLRQLCDWAMVLHTHRDAVDRASLERLLRSLGLVKAWQLFGCFAVKHLGLPAEDVPLYNPSLLEASEVVYRKVTDDGNFGFHNPDRPSPTLTDIPLMSRKSYLLRRLFGDYRIALGIAPLEATCYLVSLLCSGGYHTACQLLAQLKKR